MVEVFHKYTYIWWIFLKKTAPRVLQMYSIDFSMESKLFPEQVLNRKFKFVQSERSVSSIFKTLPAELLWL